MASIPTQAEILEGEIGAIRKAHGGRLRIALLYPNSYAVGMSNLGFHTLYRLFNEQQNIVCERAFLPDHISSTTQLRTLESGTILSDMDVIAFSISYELDYPNVPRMLRLGGVEPFAARRKGPLVLAGGATMCYNPEPLAPLLDMVFIGEAEDSISLLQSAIAAMLRGEQISDAERHHGLYLPAHGTAPVTRRHIADLDQTAIYNQIFTEHSEFGHMALVEVGRGCPYHCNFCIASHVYRPARWRTVEALLPLIERGLQYRQRVGLIGASVTDHPDILRLCEEILRRGGQPSPASMRADALTDDLLTLLVTGGCHSITLAPEAATESLRRRCGKSLTDEALFTTADRAQRAGVRHLKLYFIVGLPGETDEDVVAIPALALRLARASHLRVSLGCSAFVPKPGTPFARMAMASQQEIRHKLDLIRRGLQGKAAFTHESARWAYWQAVLARGGRELAPVLATIADGPDTPGAWNAAFRESGLSSDAYAVQAIPSDAILPWSFITDQGATGEHGSDIE